MKGKWPWRATKTYKDLVQSEWENLITWSAVVHPEVLHHQSKSEHSFFQRFGQEHKITKNRFWSLIASLVSSIFHKLYGCYSRFASFHSYWIFQILFLFWSNSQLLDRIPAVFHSGLNSRFFLQVFLLSMTDDRIPLVYYNKYQRNEAKSNIL